MNTRLNDHALTLLLAFAALPAVASWGGNQSQPASQPQSSSGATADITPVAHIEKRGAGPIAMVLIPDIDCDWTVFESFMARNAERYTMYAVTLPGFGGSKPPPLAEPDSGAWLTNAVSAILQLIQQHDLKEAAIVGHSMGGHLALRLAIEHPGAFRAAISIDGAPVTPLGGLEQNALSQADRQRAAREVAALKGAFGAREWEAHQQLRAGTMVKDPQQAEKLAQMFISVPPSTTMQYRADFILADLRPRLGEIQDPTLVIASFPTGDMRPGSLPSVRAAWEALIATSKTINLVFIDHTRHFIQFDRPAELDALIADFLAGREVSDVISPDPPAVAPETPPTENAPATQPATSR